MKESLTLLLSNRACESSNLILLYNFGNKQSERDKDRVRENVCERDRERENRRQRGKADAARSLVVLYYMTIT